MPRPRLHLPALARAAALAAALLLPLTPAPAQDKPAEPRPGTDHRHVVLAGKIGDKAEVRAVINVSPDESLGSLLEGSYHYLSQRKPIHLWGSLEGDQASLEESTRRYGESVTGRFAGTWSFGEAPGQTRFSGTWTSGDGKRRLPFTLREVREAGVHDIDFYSFSEEYARKRGSEQLHRSQSLTFPQLRGTSTAIRRVNGFIRTLALHQVDGSEDPPDPAAPPPSLLEVERAVRAPLPDPGELQDLDIGPFASLTFDETFEVLLNEDDILSLRLFHSEYTGGAHPNSNAGHVTFDLKSGEELTLDDLLQPGWRDVLTPLAEASLRAQHNLKPGDSLSKEGPLFDDSFELNANWFLTASGLGFSFDPYEIGPYAAGFIQPCIPFDELKKLIKPGSPLARLAAP